MPKTPPPDPYDPWPKREHYRTEPRKPVVMAPICPACGSRHTGATERCALSNKVEDDG